MVNNTPTLLPERQGEEHFETFHEKCFDKMQKGLDNYGSFVTFNFLNMSENQCFRKIPSKVLPLEIYGFDHFLLSCELHDLPKICCWDMHSIYN